MGDSIARKNEKWIFVCDIVTVILGDGSDGGRLHCSGISCAPVIFISGVLD